MSTIQKMSIQGIRSFGPDDRERQIIQFFNPLTLILGSNGTGKTTIIECLKYMTTGDMPPGSKGGAFIHDPKVAHEREVKGQIRLQFSDVTLKQCIVQRSVVVTQKAKKMEMRTLDGVITRCGPDGEKQSISSRCAEIDKEMVTSLGVSKAVLENVIFCHQEDANWPLSEGKSLKEKFDAIFASTRYVKALDTIRKVKTEQDGSLREYRTEIKYLRQNKEHAGKLQDKLGDFEAKFAACQESMDKLKAELRPVEERLDELNAKASEISKITAKLDVFGAPKAELALPGKSRSSDLRLPPPNSLRNSGYIIEYQGEKVLGEKDMLEKSIRELQSNIENEFQGNTRELERCLHEFQDKVGDVESTVTQFENKRKSLQREIEQLQAQRQKVDIDVGKLQQEATVHEDTIQQRDALIRTLANEYGFEGLDHGVINDEKYTQFALSMKSTVDKFIGQAAQVKNEHDSRESELQMQVDSVKEQRTKLEQNCHMKKQTMDKNQREIRQISQKLSDVDASAGRLDQLVHELRQAERELQNVQSSVNLDELKTDIDKLQIEKRDMDAKVNTLSAEMNKLHQQSSTQTEINMLNKQKVEREDGIRRIKSRHEETLKYLLEGALTLNVRSDLDDYLFKQTDSVKQAERQLQEAKMELSRKEFNKKHLMDMVKKKEQELKGYEEKISGVCGSQNYEDGLSALQQKMTTAQDTRGTLIGAEHFFKKYVTDFKKDDPCCPLCHRAFDAEQEVRELILELENKLRLVPSRMQKSETDLEQLQNQYDEMLQLKPIQDSMSSLEEELPELHRKVVQLTSDIDKLKSSIQDKEQDLQAKQNDEGMASALKPDIIMMDRYMGEVRDLDRKIASMSAKMAAAGSGRTLEQVTEEKDDAQMLLETVNCQLEHKREKRSNHSEKLHQMKSHVNELMANKMTIERDLADRNKLEERKNSLSVEIETLRKDIQEAEEELAPLQGQINRLMQEKERVRKMKEEDVDKIRSQVDAVRSKGTDVRQLNAKIKKYVSEGKANTLQRQQEKQLKIQTDISELSNDDVELSNNLDSRRKELADQKEVLDMSDHHNPPEAVAGPTYQVHERELLDNLQLHKKRSEIAALEKTINSTQEQIGGYDMASLEISKRQTENTRDGMRREYHEANLRQKTHEEGVRQAKEELSSAQYKNATIDYRDKMIILRTTEIANMDLEKYYKALDRAIMNYHNMKMHEINKIIRELWRNTYRGNDIETIEIRSDEDESGIMKQRRNYHYRVVMVKGNNTELDMRGRCSAGQKVLASLIIRLALAETFCLNCGILALDEPTTNLDRENIESLAYALVEIIKSREGQRNFQLIVITHDEDFVELLGRSDFVDDFFKIKKTPNGFSQITKAKVSELHMR